METSGAETDGSSSTESTSGPRNLMLIEEETARIRTLTSLQEEIMLHLIVASEAVYATANGAKQVETLIERMTPNLTYLCWDMACRDNINILHHPKIMDFPILTAYLPQMTRMTMFAGKTLPEGIHFDDCHLFHRYWKRKEKKRELLTNVTKHLTYRELGMRPTFSKSRGVILRSQAAVEVKPIEHTLLHNRWPRIQRSALKISSTPPSTLCNLSEMKETLPTTSSGNSSTLQMAEWEKEQEICRADRKREEDEDKYNLVMTRPYCGILPKPYRLEAPVILPKIIRSHENPRSLDEEEMAAPETP